MDILKTILLYLSMLFISAVQTAPDPSTVDVTPTPAPTPFGIVATATPVPTPSPTPVPTPDITPNATYGQLNMGDRDDAVTQMQQRLQELGYYTGDIDGAYGNQTRHAVELFQYQNGLTVDGIAGRYTLTILYEDANVKAAPPEIVVTNTPVFYPETTDTPAPAAETPEATQTAAPTPSSNPSPEPTAAAEPTAEPTAAPLENQAIVVDAYSFVFAGHTEPMTAEGSGAVLHPAEADEALYVPLLEILKSAGNVVIDNTEGSTREYAFSVLTDFYQVSFSLLDDGSLSNLTIEKNAQPQPLTTRNAVMLEGIVYLPLQDVQRMTDIGFMIDDVSGMITVTMP